jgi:hypothetical protein
LNESTRGAGWLLFAGIMILVAGTLNVIWGIAAIDDANFFIQEERYILSDLNTWGWIILIIGVIQVIAAFSIWAGGQFGRWIGIFSASIGALGALLSIPGFPLWSVCLFGLDVLVIYGLVVYGGQRTA